MINYDHLFITNSNIYFLHLKSIKEKKENKSFTLLLYIKGINDWWRKNMSFVVVRDKIVRFVIINITIYVQFKDSGASTKYWMNKRENKIK